VASIPAGVSVDIECQTVGDAVLGNTVWNYLPSYGGYASDAYLWTGYDGFAPSLPRCSASPASRESPSSTVQGYALPLACGTSAGVSQGNGSGFSHSGAAYYAFDFALPRGTPLVAMNDGVVSLVNGSVGPGQACWSGGGPECANTLNYVVVQHADGTDTAYLHADAVLVTPGQSVRRGDRVALSGGTGWSTGPHAHVQRQQRCGSWWCQSVSLAFGDVPGGVPSAGQNVTSGNCR
jgi:murein DD-endopeptidase MepM/ murein hydrolase activator NlpD